MYYITHEKYPTYYWIWLFGMKDIIWGLPREIPMVCLLHIYNSYSLLINSKIIHEKKNHALNCSSTFIFSFKKWHGHNFGIIYFSIFQDDDAPFSKMTMLQKGFSNSQSEFSKLQSSQFLGTCILTKLGLCLRFNLNMLTNRFKV